MHIFSQNHKKYIVKYIRKSLSLFRRGFKDFLVASSANAPDDKHFSSNAGNAMKKYYTLELLVNLGKRQTSGGACDVCLRKSYKLVF